MKNISSLKKTGIAIVLTLILISVPLVTNAAVLYRQLQFGMSGSDVSDLQAFLARDVTIYPQGLVTGYFGSLTRAAVVRFQVRNGISPVGRVGPITLAHINSQMGSVGGESRVINPLSLNVLNNQASFSWTTSENSSSWIYYSTSPLVLTEATDATPFSISGGTNVTVNITPTTQHSTTLTGLSSNTRYYYVIYVKDVQGNESITLPATFQTTN